MDTAITTWEGQSATRSNDHAEFERLVGRTQRQAYNVAYRLTGNRDDAEDLTQEAYLRAYRSFGTYNRQLPFESWFFRILSNLFIDLSGQRPASLADAKLRGLPVVAYGTFLNDVISFLIIAFVIFLVIKAMNRLRAAPPPPPNTKDCPYCLAVIPLAASRCASCCSDVPA